MKEQIFFFSFLFFVFVVSIAVTLFSLCTNQRREKSNRRRSEVIIGEKVFSWCQSSSMYVKILLIQSKITNKTMNSKRMNTLRETYGSHVTVLLLSLYTTSLVTIEIHLDKRVKFHWSIERERNIFSHYHLSLSPPSCSCSCSFLLWFDCFCLMTKDNLIGIEHIVIYRFHTSLTS